ncbi:MAG: 4Fe-4S binding protein [Calditrichaeota bacterium]|nr:4Fe-4S binding protein [Calditrichota bacterium]
MPLIDLGTAAREGLRGQQEVGGQSVSVIRAPRPIPQGLAGRTVNGLGSLLTGMRITFRYFRKPSTVVTRQYPENRDTLKMPERYRARLIFLYEEDGLHRCTGCRICEKACPNTSIIIATQKGEASKKPEIERYTWRLDTCTFCNACVQACPHDAIIFDGKFESSVFDRRLLVYNLNTYAGPHSALAAKIEDPEARAASMVPVGRYEGALPLSGTAMDGLPALESRGGTKE